MDGNFSNKIFFSDVAHFTLGGYVNKQNCRIWDFKNLQVIEERPLHREKVLLSTLNGPKVLRKRRWNDCPLRIGALWSYDNRYFFPALE